MFRLTGEFNYCKCSSRHTDTPLLLDASQGPACLIMGIDAEGC